MSVNIQRRVWECVPGCTHHILLVFSARRYHHYSNNPEPSHRFWDGWSPHPPFPTCPSQPEISCGKLTLRPARSSDLCMQLPPQTELKPHEKHPAGKNKSLTWKRLHCQQEPQGSGGCRVTGVRSRPMLVGRDIFCHPRLGVMAHTAASAQVVSTNMCSHLSWEEKHCYWHWAETGFHRKSPQLLLRGKAMTLRGNFPFFISYIVSCFAVEFHGKKEECVFRFYQHFFPKLLLALQKDKNSSILKESLVGSHGCCNHSFSSHLSKRCESKLPMSQGSPKQAFI